MDEEMPEHENSHVISFLQDPSPELVKRAQALRAKSETVEKWMDGPISFLGGDGGPA